METFLLVFLLLNAVLVSAFVDSKITHVSAPLIQIAMGIVISLLAPASIEVTLDPEVFLIVFIAPLLYEEARSSDIASLWKFKAPILSYAVVLVLVIVFSVGFTVNALIPSIPLAAAFALGAALGPTDAVAVASVSKETSLPEHTKSILKGESLINDASGLVAFSFAVAAVGTGAFSLADAGIEFCIEFFGGLGLGLVAGALVNLTVKTIIESSPENSKFQVLLELSIPFTVFLLAEAVHVSGVLAVVACGIVNTLTPRTSSPSQSRTAIVSNSVWQVVTFALNGIVFVLLGTQLPEAFLTVNELYDIPAWLLLLDILAISAVLEGTRFVWSMAREALTARKEKRRVTGADVRNALALTLSGAKGTITLSIMFTLPFYVESLGSSFPRRPLLIFLACGVILVTLLLATYVVPKLVPKPKTSKDERQEHLNDVESMIEVLRLVIETISDRQTSETKRATRMVVRAYIDRLNRLKEAHAFGDDDVTDDSLNLKVLGWQRDYVKRRLAEGSVDPDIAQDVVGILEEQIALTKHEGVDSIQMRMVHLKVMLSRMKYRMAHHLPLISPSEENTEKYQLVTDVYRDTVRHLEEELQGQNLATEQAAALLVNYQRRLQTSNTQAPSVTSMKRTSDKADEIERMALRLELRYINEMCEEGRMSKAYAKRVRENVAMMQLDLENRL